MSKFKKKDSDAVSVDRTRDLQIFSLTLSQLSYPRLMLIFSNKLYLSVSSIDNSWSTARTCGRCLGHLAWVFGQAVRTARPATASAVDDGFMHAVAVVSSAAARGTDSQLRVHQRPVRRCPPARAGASSAPAASRGGHAEACLLRACQVSTPSPSLSPVSTTPSVVW